MIRHRNDYVQPEVEEFNTLPSETIPGQSMSNSEYVQKFSMGVPIFGAGGGNLIEGDVFADDDENDNYSVFDDYLDPTERDAAGRAFEEYARAKSEKRASLANPGVDREADVRETRDSEAGNPEKVEE